MTEEQINALVLSEARGNQTGFTSDFEADARNALPRLLEERKRLLDELRRFAMDEPYTYGAVLRARIAIAFAEEVAP